MTLKERYGADPPLDVRQHVRVMLSASGGLEFLHSHGVVHRDLTTRNIMMTAGAGSGPEDGQCKITDAGVARALGDASGDEHTMTAAPGAQKYMAPETRDENGKGFAKYGPKADIYSLGVSVMAMINKREPPSVWVLASCGHEGDLKAVPDDHPLLLFVTQCIAFSPHKRSAAHELCSELAKVNANYPSPADSATEMARIKAEKASLQRQLDETAGERDRLLSERNCLSLERDALARERDQAILKSEHLTEEVKQASDKVHSLRKEHNPMKTGPEHIQQYPDAGHHLKGNVSTPGFAKCKSATSPGKGNSDPEGSMPAKVLDAYNFFHAWYYGTYV